MFEGGASVAQNDTHNKRGAFLCSLPSSSGVNYIIITEGIRVRALKKARCFTWKTSVLKWFYTAGIHTALRVRCAPPIDYAMFMR